MKTKVTKITTLLFILLTLILLSGCGNSQEYSLVGNLCPEMNEKINYYMTEEEITAILDEKYERLDTSDDSSYYNCVYTIGNFGNMTMLFKFTASSDGLNGQISTTGAEEDLISLLNIFTDKTIEESEGFWGYSSITVTYTDDQKKEFIAKDFKEQLAYLSFASVKSVHFFGSSSEYYYYSRYVQVEETENDDYNICFAINPSYDLAPMEEVAQETLASVDRLCPELKEKIHCYMTEDEINAILGEKYPKLNSTDWTYYHNAYDVGTIGNMTMTLSFNVYDFGFSGQISTVASEKDLNYLLNVLANETDKSKGFFERSYVKVVYDYNNWDGKNKEEKYTVKEFKEYLNRYHLSIDSIKYITFHSSSLFSESFYEYVSFDRTEDYINYLICFPISKYDLAPADDILKNTQAQENYRDAYESTVALENYTVGSEISFEKNGLFGGGISISGNISKNNGIYSGDVVMEMPGNTYNYTYASPYGEIDTWASMNKGEKSIFLPFNVANLGAGIIQPLSDEIISTGVLTAENLQTVKFSVTNDQAYELYGSIIDYFKKAAEKSIDISDLKFSSGTITVTIQNGMIKDYKVVLDGNASAGSITCEFSCNIK